ncbi:hypothetical protein, partial [Dickeya oryzae]
KLHTYFRPIKFGKRFPISNKLQLYYDACGFTSNVVLQRFCFFKMVRLSQRFTQKRSAFAFKTASACRF